MLNVMFVTNGSGITSGAFHSLLVLCRELKEKYDCRPVVILCKSSKGKRLFDEYEIESKFIRSYSWVIPADQNKTIITKISFLLKKTLNIIAKYRILRVIKKDKIGIVHINTTGYYIGALAAKMADIPYVWHLRDVLSDDYNFDVYDKSSYEVMDGAARRIAISRFVFDKYSVFLKNPIDVIYNGVNVCEYYDPYKHLFETKDRVNFACVANMTGNKGQKTVIEAAKLLCERNIQNFTIYFAGNGKRENEYKKYVDELGIDSVVKFCGALKNVRDIYKHSDVSIVASQAEAFGRVTIESMMQGCVVVGAKGGATPELIDDNWTGILFEVNDAYDLSLKMEMIIAGDKDKYINIASEGQKYALDHFTSIQNTENVYKIYRDILAR